MTTTAAPSSAVCPGCGRPRLTLPERVNAVARRCRLTPAQLKVLQYVMVSDPLCPSIQEIADALGVSKVTVFEHLNELEKKGAITRVKHASRSIRVLEGLVG